MLCSGAARRGAEDSEESDARAFFQARAGNIVHLAEALRERPNARTLAHSIEHGAAVWSENKQRQYNRKIYSILWAIERDPTILDRHQPWDVAFVKEELLVAAAGKEQGAQGQGKAASQIFEHVKQLLTERSTHSRSCKRCKATHTIETLAMQTRSADEGMTYFYRCTACGHTTKA